MRTKIPAFTHRRVHCFRDLSVVGVSAALAFVAIVPSTAPAAMVGPSMFLDYNTYQNEPIFNGYVLFSNLVATAPRATLTRLSSPGGDFSSALNPGETFAGASSGVTPDFATYKTLVNSTAWTLKVDADTATPTTYLFDVLASALAD